MSNPDALAPSSDASTRRFTGPSEFQALVREMLARAVTEAWREIVIADCDFADWPLGERAVAQSLQDWARSGRKLVMLASRYDEVTRRHARFAAWRGKWAHIVECWVCPRVEPPDFPSALWSPVAVLVRQDVERSTGVLTSDARRRTQTRELLEEWRRRSSPGFPATTLGL